MHIEEAVHLPPETFLRRDRSLCMTGNLSRCMCTQAQLLQSCLTLCSPVDCSLPGPLPMGFSRQEYCSGLPCPSPGDLSHPGIESTSLVSSALAGRFFTTEPPGKPSQHTYWPFNFAYLSVWAHLAHPVNSLGSNQTKKWEFWLIHQRRWTRK